jgi:putative serine protease PepD
VRLAEPARTGVPYRSCLAVVAVSTTFALLGACSGSSHEATPPSPAATQTTTTTSALGLADALQQAFIRVVDRVRPSVVQISTTNGLGSGVVLDSAGNIVTNAHVVGDATTFEVTLADGRSMHATLVGAYVPDDLAVIRISSQTLPPPATFGDSAALQVGEITLAIGNPLGLASSVTEGIVSFNGRTVSEANGAILPAMVQTSAPINPGNSGGALVDLDGQVIGIPTLAANDTQNGGAAAGIGFAIPSNTVKLIAGQLAATGTVSNTGRAALGIRGASAVSATGVTGGVIVAATEPGGAANRAGIVAGDVITAVGNRQTPTLAALLDILSGLKPGDAVTVTVLRSGDSRSVAVTLGELPAS